MQRPASGSTRRDSNGGQETSIEHYGDPEDLRLVKTDISTAPEVFLQPLIGPESRLASSNAKHGIANVSSGLVAKTIDE
jgi:hypothetical protein